MSDSSSNIKETTHSVDLRDVIDFFAKAYKVNGKPPVDYKWAINPIDNKVIFILKTYS